MKTDYWAQHAELHRKADDQPMIPDAPIRPGSVKIADGTLGEMLDHVGALSPVDRLDHVIFLAGGSLSDTMMESMLKQPRTAEG